MHDLKNPREASPWFGGGADLERLARLMRFCQRTGMGEDLRSSLKSMLLSQIEILSPEEVSGSKSAATYKVTRSSTNGATQAKVREWSDQAQSAVPIPQEVKTPDQMSPTSAPRVSRELDGSDARDEQRRSASDRDAIGSTPTVEPGAIGDAGASVDGVAAMKLRLRSMVDADAPWSTMGPVAWKLFEQQTSAEVAARLVELSFIHGGVREVEEVLGRLRDYGKGFYLHVHPVVRAHLVAGFWREGQCDVLSSYLFHYKDAVDLQPIERLCFFYLTSGARDSTAGYLYFRKYQKSIVDAVRQVGPHVGLSPARLHLIAGQMALNLGFDDEARQYLEHVGPDAPEYDEALHLILEASAQKHDVVHSTYRDLLLKEHRDEKRLALLRDFLAQTRSLGGFRDKNRAALNELLRDPLAYFSHDPAVLGKLSQVLVENRDLDQLLPTIYEAFRRHALTFRKPDQDRALWQNLVETRAQHPRDIYWRGVALLHHFVSSGLKAESALWQAKDLVAQARAASQFPLPFDWKELHQATLGWVTRTTHVTEVERQALLKQLRVATHDDLVTVEDVEEYLAACEKPPPLVLQRLASLASRKKAPALETKLVLKRVSQSHLVNDDLQRLWDIAAARQDADLAWRVATILAARQSLAPQVQHAWQISGEQRSQYPFVSVPATLVEQCLAGFSKVHARLAHAVFAVGRDLPELLAILDKNSHVSRTGSAKADSIEAKIDAVLGGLSWLGPQRKRYIFTFDGAISGVNSLAFAQVLPSNPWSKLTATLGERLGLNAWGWTLSRLHGQIADLIPRLASRQDLKRHSGRVARWLKTLTPQQRCAWQDIATLGREVSDEEAANTLACFVCRLSTVILQNHHQALTSLMVMRAPTEVLWDQERWILSESYSKIRKTLGTQCRVLVPHSLKRMKSIVSPPEISTMQQR